MPSKVQRSPGAIHGLFDTAGTGNLPNQLLDDIRPSVSLLDFYGSLVWETQFFSGFFAPGDFNRITVPVGQTWLLKTVEVLATLPAGPITDHVNVIEIGFNSPSTIATVSEYQVPAPFTPGIVRTHAWQAPGDGFMLQAGGSFGVRNRVLVGAANLSLTYQASYYRL